jgi:hypothetical protein
LPARLHVAAHYQADGFETRCHFQMIADNPVCSGLISGGLVYSLYTTVNEAAKQAYCQYIRPDDRKIRT